MLIGAVPLFRTIVGLLVVLLLAREVILGLGKGVPTGNSLDPLVTDISSAVQVPLGEVDVFAGLGNVLLVVLVFLGLVLAADFSVLRSTQAFGNIRVGSDLANLQLYWSKYAAQRVLVCSCWQG
jgi:hypothetical protein